MDGVEVEDADEFPAPHVLPRLLFQYRCFHLKRLCYSGSSVPSLKLHNADRLRHDETLHSARTLSPETCRYPLFSAKLLTRCVSECGTRGRDRDISGSFSRQRMSRRNSRTYKTLP
jgi:hypothetical protein